MRTKHTFLSLLLACFLLAGLLPATAFAADVTDWDGVMNAPEGDLTLTQGATITGSADITAPQKYDLTGKTITLKGKLTISGHVKLTGGKILRDSDTDPLFYVSGGGASLTLEAITLDGSGSFVSSQASLIEIDGGGTVTLGSGSVLTNNHLLEFTQGKGSAVTVTDSTLNISGGNITDNQSTTDNGSTIKTYYGATVTMTAGTISGNSNSKHGGAIQLYGARPTAPGETKKTMFVMTGGEISNNACAFDSGVGGGVAISNTAVFIMTGGRITGNACGANGKGGGVAFADGNNTAMQISGAAFITGNTKGLAEDNIVNNLEIGTNANNLLEVTGPVTGNIGITRTGNSTTVFTTSGPAVTPADSILRFSSDAKNYKVVSEAGQLKLQAAPETIAITTQPQNAQATAGSVSGSLTVAATVSGGTLTYQWYACADASGTNPQAIPGETGASFTIPTTLTAGTYYYFCRVSGTQAPDVSSDVATVTVQPSPVIRYTVGVSANTPAGGAVTGGGTYDANTTVTVTASPNSGYKFARWTENGLEVSKSASYTFAATANRALVAVFEEDQGGDPGDPGTPGDPGNPGDPGTPGDPGNTGDTKSPVEQQSPVNHQEVFVNVGGNATISVNELDAASYQWYVDCGNGFAPIEGATGPSYTIPAAGLEHDGYRYCCVYVSANGSSNQSPIFTLRVGALVDIPDTGDNSRLGILGGLGLTVASLVALTACKVLWRRKRAD